MNLGKILLLSGACIAAANVSAGTLLDDVIRCPGFWDQMCAMPAPIPPDVPLPLYSLAARRTFRLSEPNADRLREHRSEVVADIVQRLAVMDLSKPKPYAPAPTVQSFGDSGQDPSQINGTLLEIILELDAVEALPGLLRVEEDLDKRLATAVADDGAPLPWLALDSPLMVTITDFTKPPTPRETREFVARVYQREMLAVIAALLRHERFKPLLESKMEAKYREYLLAQSGQGSLSGITTAADIPPGNERWIVMDPIYHLPVLKTPVSAFIPYSPALRTEIRQYAGDYLKQTASATKAVSKSK